MNTFVCYGKEQDMWKHLKKNCKTQYMLTHFEAVGCLIETTLTWDFRDTNPAILSICYELNCVPQIHTSQPQYQTPSTSECDLS